MSKKQAPPGPADYMAPERPPFESVGPIPGLGALWSVKIQGPYGSFEFTGPAEDGKEALKQFLDFAREVIP